MDRYVLPSIAVLLLAALLASTVEGLAEKSLPGHMGQVTDWSSRHVLYPQGASLRTVALGQRDPRAYWSYLNLLRAAGEARIAPPPRVGHPRPLPSRVDWSVSLGAAGTAQHMFPAKFSFDVNAAPNCASDFVVFAINVAPTATQANIAAFNNLYSGVGSTSCFPNTTATVTWAYRTGARVRTSPIISLDGTKVAFVDGANPAVFHLLAPSPNQGTVGAPATPVAAGPGQQIFNITLAGSADNNSSPFMDYYGDVCYVGLNNGLLYKIVNVFRGTPALAGAPWPITAGATTLTGPVIDFGTGNIFVGSANGNLYGFTPAGVAIPSSPLAVGSGRANGGIADPPVVDVVNGLIFVTSGEDPTRTFSLVASASTSSFAAANVNVAPIGNNNAAPLHAGTLNDAYFNAATNVTGSTSEWFFYACGAGAGAATNPVLYRVGFNGTPRKLNTTANATTVALSANGGEQCSPITELKNGVDRIFLGLLTTARVEFFDISTTTTPTLGGTGAVAPVAEAGGTSGIIVDNVSPIAQASSIYFTTLANSANCGATRCGVKLTQGGLQ